MTRYTRKKHHEKNGYKWIHPPLTEWIDIIHEIYIMERSLFSLRAQKQKLYQLWTKLIECVKPLISDLI